MRTRSRNPFTTVKTAGLLLPIDLLSRIADGDRDLAGLTPESFHLNPGERLNEAVTRAWNACQSAWKTFRQAAATLPASDAGTTLTRDRWLLTLFKELGYGRLQPQKAIEINEKTYPISHGWSGHIPIHLVSFRYELERRTPSASGAATRSPYSLMQELLNRSSVHRWGFLSNGLRLFVLRDNASLSRAANVEFDLETMFDSEAYADFLLLFLVCHQSRVEIPPEGKPEDCWLEKWSKLADDQGTRAREKLRDGVQQAIEALGAGFLTTAGNHGLRDRLRSGELATQDYYRQLLRVVYRLLLLLVAEEKRTENGQNLLHPPGTSEAARQRYSRFYSVGRIRTLATQRRGTAHTDLYASLKVLFEKLRAGYDPLGIPALGSFLFSDSSTPDLDGGQLSNQSLLDAIRALCITEDTSGRSDTVRRPVDFANLGSDELGSVYESLLELHPRIDANDGGFTLGTAAGNERKTTGSYYTPTSLINCLLDSALDPVVHEALDKPDVKQAEDALLNLKVCDPACGSGHFLISAADRLARHLATLRTGDDEPSALLIQHAKRDIIGHCIYGVDINPMSVELCKVALWMEAMEPGKPLTFLDHHIQCGNSLLGTTPALLTKGIPDGAFTPIEGDIKARVTELKKANKKERNEYEQGQGYLFSPYIKLGNIASEFVRLNSAPDGTLAEVDALQKQYARLVKSSEYESTQLLADLWCAVFAWNKDDSEIGKMCPTERDFRKVESHAAAGLLPHVRQEVESLRDRYQFFHWHLAFPDVFRLPGKNETPENEKTGWNSGFDVILGNPPWEMAELSEKEFFASRSPQIANAPTARVRKQLLDNLVIIDPLLHGEFTKAKRALAVFRTFVQSSSRFPTSSSGRINSYPLFVESSATFISQRGRVGQIVPSAVAMDAYNAGLFRWLATDRRLLRMLDFENRDAIFPGVHRSYRFCLLTLQAATSQEARFCFLFFGHNPEEANQAERNIELSLEELRACSPNTLAPPMFHSLRDANITLPIYKTLGILLNRQSTTMNNLWSISIQRMLSLSDPGDLFRTANELAASGEGGDPTQWMRLYSGKTIHQFNHRFATWRGDDWEASSDTDLRDAVHEADTEYCVRRIEVEKRTAGKLPATWLIGYRDVCRATDERTIIASVIPLVGCDTHCRNIYFTSLASQSATCLIANLNSFVLDYFCRQKVVAIGLGSGIMEQLPVLPPSTYTSACPWSGQLQSTFNHQHFLLPRVLELTYTAWDLEPFASECGYAGPPFRWDEERRFVLRAELDAAFFHLYGLNRDDAAYILDTFPIVRRKDIEKHGTYRTKDTILEIFDAMAVASRNGEAYQTCLKPLPGPPLDDSGAFLPLTEWDVSNWPSHIHLPRDEQ